MCAHVEYIHGILCMCEHVHVSSISVRVSGDKSFKL